MKTTRLFIKEKSGQPMRETSKIVCDTNGIKGCGRTLLLRQVLIVPESTLNEFNIIPEVLRANILINGGDLHKIESGTVICIGGVRIRLTFHCESCDRLKPHVNPKDIAHKRGILGSFLNGGEISVGDDLVVEGQEYEPIPFNPTERLKWYLTKNPMQITSIDLLKEIGFSKSYCRVLPKWLASLESNLTNLVIWLSVSKSAEKTGAQSR